MAAFFDSMWGSREAAFFFSRMDFFNALRSAHQGERIQRESWQNRLVYVLLKDDILALHSSKGEYYNWLVTKEHMDATDWVTTSGG